MACTTHINMVTRDLRRALSQELKKKFIDKHVEGKDYNTISKQLKVSVRSFSLQKFKVNRTIANFTGRSRKKIDNKLKRWIIRMGIKAPRD